MFWPIDGVQQLSVVLHHNKLLIFLPVYKLIFPAAASTSQKVYSIQSLATVLGTPAVGNTK